MGLFDLLFYLLAFAVGYVARKYVEKRWPNEAALLDTIGTRYGEQAKAALQGFVNAAAAAAKPKE